MDYTLAILCTFLLLFFLLLIRSFNIWIKPLRLLKKGEIHESIEIFNKLLKTLKKPALKRIALYDLAVCYHRKGDFQKSIEYLEAMKKEKIIQKSTNLEGAYFALYAHNLLMLNQNLVLAEKYLEKAVTLVQLPYLSLYKAYFHLLKGNIKNAETGFENFLSNEQKKKFILGLYATLFIDQTFNEIVNNFMIGSFFLKKGDCEKAKEYLEKVKNSPYPNFYKQKAEELVNAILL